MIVRLAIPNDAHAIASVQIASWRVTYRGVMSDETLDALDVDARAARWRTIVEAGTTTTRVAIAGERVIAFCSVGPSRDEGAADGTLEIQALYAHPDAFGQGAGRLLFDETHRAAREAGARAITLWVAERNPRGRGFYEHVGMRWDGARKSEAIGGRDVDELRYALEVRSLPDRDASPDT